MPQHLKLRVINLIKNRLTPSYSLAVRNLNQATKNKVENRLVNAGRPKPLKIRSWRSTITSFKIWYR